MTLPQPPANLPPEQAAIWADTTTRLTALGIDTVDPRHLRAYTRAAHTLDQTTYLLDQAGPLIQRGDHAAPNPATTTHRQAARDLARLAITLGLTRPDAAAAPVHGGAPMQGARPGLYGQAAPPFRGAWRCDLPGHTWWHGTCHKKGGEQCHNPIPRGLTTCRMHPGGNAKVKHLAAVAASEVARLGGPLPEGRPLPDVHPADALLYQVRYWAGLAAWLDEVVGELERGAMVWGMTRQTVEQGGEYPGTTVVHQAGLAVWVQWHERAHNMLARVCEIALRAEVDQAALALQQAQGMQAFRAFQAGLQRLALTADQWALARQEMPKVLRALVVA